MPPRTTTAKPTAAKRAPAKKAAARPRKAVPAPMPEAPPEVREVPLVVFEHRPAARDARRVLVFEVDDRKFYTQSPPPTGTLLTYLKLLRKSGYEAAHLYLIEAMCGEDAYDALADDPTTTVDDVAQVVGELKKLLMGTAEDPKA